MRLFFLLNLLALPPLLAQEPALKFDALLPQKCEWRATWTEIPSTHKEIETTQALRLYKFFLLPIRPLARVQTALWTRYEPIYRAKVQWSDGVMTESWLHEKIAVIGNIPKSGDPQTFEVKSKPKIFYNHVDLFELWWVKEEHFKGEVLFQKTKCRHYHDGDGRQAWFSVETRKPLAIQNGNVQIAYEFLSEPLSLIVPDEIQKILQMHHAIQGQKKQEQR